MNWDELYLKRKTSSIFLLERRLAFSLFALFICFLAGSTTLAQHPVLRSHESTRAKNGLIIESSVLADVEGKVFIEVPQNVIVKKFGGEDLESFDGFIMAPEVIALPVPFPINRYRDIVVFEFLSDTVEDIRFTDKYYGLRNKQLRQLESINAEYKRRKLKAFFPIHKSLNLQRPALWYYQLEKGTWTRLGGVYEETSDPDVDLFSTSVSRTGLFALMDEDPRPISTEEFHNPDTSIQLAEASPFPSVVEDSETDLTFYDEDAFLTEDTDNLFSANEVPAQENSRPVDLRAPVIVEVPASAPLPQEILEESLRPAPNDTPTEDNTLFPENGSESNLLRNSVRIGGNNDGDIPETTTNEFIDPETGIKQNEVHINVPVGFDGSGVDNTMDSPKLPQTGNSSTAPLYLLFSLLILFVTWRYRKILLRIEDEFNLHH